MAIVNFVLYNAAISGFTSGIRSKRNPTFDATLPVATVEAAAILYATQVDLAIQNGRAEAPILALLNGGATRVPATSAQANAAESLPSAFAAPNKAAWEGRSLPQNPDGTAYTQAQYAPVANAVASAFVQFCTNTDNS